MPMMKKNPTMANHIALGNLIFITSKPLWIINETSQIPQILPGTFLKQEILRNGGMGVDDVVIFQM